MLVKSFLRRLVVHGADAENTVDAAPIGRLQLFDNSGSAVTSASHKQWHSSGHTLDEGGSEPLLLFPREARGLGCGAHDTEEVGTILDLELDKLDEGVAVDTAVGLEGGDECYA